MTRRSLFAPVLQVALVVASAIGTTAAEAGKTTALPEIRTSADNRVPRCVTPDRLMAFLKSRNPKPDPRYRDIARYYKQWGEAWRVRWDYAFFQMAIETNFLTFRQPNGKMGDVDPRQNNFAGIGTTGGGVPGDRFPDVKTGVLAQIQHLVAYSGERLANPVAPRTQLKQDDIISASLRLNRSVRFSDLSRRWAVDPKYGSSIAWVAEQFRLQQCLNPDVGPPQEVAAPRPAKAAAPLKIKPVEPVATRPVEPAAPSAPGPGACLIQAASYGGRATVLIRYETGQRTEYTALTVLDGFESSMTERYIEARAPGATTIGSYHDQTAALAKARELCPPDDAAEPALEASAR